MSKFKCLLLVCLPFFLVTLYLQRHVFFNTYDHEYMHDYYSFSQWALPLSSRIMGDGDLYAYSGYSLTQDFKPYAINPETPIFAKLSFGYSSLVFGNPHIASVIFVILLLWGADVLAKRHFGFSKNKRVLLALLIFTSAEIQEQFVTTLLDLPQAVFFVWHLVCLFSATNKQAKLKERHQLILNMSIAGLLLGFMTASKLGLYTPFILLADIWYLYTKKQIKYALILSFMALLGYLLPYIPFLISDGIIAFLKAQKWTLNFYLSSVVVAPKGMLLITAFTGWYKGWSNSTWERVATWNGEWGLGLLAIFATLFSWAKTKKIHSKELAAILIALTCILLLLLRIPFWPRYFVFFIPFFWIFVLHWFKTEKLLILLLLFPVISTMQLISHSYAQPTSYLDKWNTGAYEELYNNYFSSDLKQKFTRTDFVSEQLLEYERVHPYEVRTELTQSHSNNSEIKHIVYVKLFGYFGRSELKKEVTWKREHAQWKISIIETLSRKVEPYSEPKYVTCINPSQVGDWGVVYKALGDYYQKVDINAKEHIMKLTPRNYCIPYATAQNLEYTFPKGITILTNPNQ